MEETIDGSRHESAHNEFAACLKSRRYNGAFFAIHTAELAKILADTALSDMSKLVLLGIAILTYWEPDYLREIYAGEIADLFGQNSEKQNLVTPNTITKHIRKLRDGGYIGTCRMKPRGPLTISYDLSAHYWADFQTHTAYDANGVSHTAALKHLRYNVSFIPFNVIELQLIFAAPLTPAQKVVFLALALKTHTYKDLTYKGNVISLAKATNTDVSGTYKHLTALKAAGYVNITHDNMRHCASWQYTFPVHQQAAIRAAKDREPGLAQVMDTMRVKHVDAWTHKANTSKQAPVKSAASVSKPAVASTPAPASPIKIQTTAPLLPPLTEPAQAHDGWSEMDALHEASPAPFTPNAIASMVFDDIPSDDESDYRHARRYSISLPSGARFTATKAQFEVLFERYATVRRMVEIQNPLLFSPHDLNDFVYAEFTPIESTALKAAREWDYRADSLIAQDFDPQVQARPLSIDLAPQICAPKPKNRLLIGEGLVPNQQATGSSHQYKPDISPECLAIEITASLANFQTKCYLDATGMKSTAGHLKSRVWQFITQTDDPEWTSLTLLQRWQKIEPLCLKHQWTW